MIKPFLYNSYPKGTLKSKKKKKMIRILSLSSIYLTLGPSGTLSLSQLETSPQFLHQYSIAMRPGIKDNTVPCCCYCFCPMTGWGGWCDFLRPDANLEKKSFLWTRECVCDPELKCFPSSFRSGLILATCCYFVKAKLKVTLVIVPKPSQAMT